jgi:hypothetical protein
MRSLAILGSASMLVLISATEGGAETLCVDPGDAGCFATIQAAVQAAASGDVVSIRPKADGSAYNEAVTIETPNLTIAGEGGPTFRSVASMIQFSGLRTVDLDDPDVGLWLDNYPDAQDFPRRARDARGLHRRGDADRRVPGGGGRGLRHARHRVRLLR